MESAVEDESSETSTHRTLRVAAQANRKADSLSATSPQFSWDGVWELQ